MSFVRFYTAPNFEAVTNEFEKAVEQIWGNETTTERTATAWEPRVDVAENDNAFVLSFELPGVSKDDLSIEFDKGNLKISGERKRNESEKWIRSERRYGKFERTLRIKTAINSENINAEFSNGILLLTLPKAEEAKPKTITIK